MQRMVVTWAILFALALVSGTSFAQDQKIINQQVAEAIADKLSDKYPEYKINVRYNTGVATLIGELYSVEQAKDAANYVESLPGVNKVVNNLKVQQQTQIQAMPVTTRIGGAGSQTIAPQIVSEPAVSASPAIATTQPGAGVFQQVSGQMQGVTDFSQQAIPTVTPVAPTTAPVVAPIAAPAAPTVMAPIPTLAPAPTPAPTVQASYVESPQLADYDTTQMFNGQVNVAPTTITTQPGVTYAQGPNFSNMPLPMGAQSPTAGRYDQPNMPNYAWPTYAAPNNYAEVAYPRLYCPQAAPYIGPFYPYPQVPMGWRKVTLEWHDGYWWLDFDDGTAKGPFSPLFRQPNPKRY